MKTSRSAFFAACLALAALPDTGVSASSDKANELYLESCISCHAFNLGGGLGGNLADGLWKHGGTDGDIVRVISHGLPDLGMPAFGKTLSAEQIRSLVVFLREKEKSTKTKSSPPPQPQEGGVVRSLEHAYKVEPVIDADLTTPWSLAFLPDGSRLVTERPGALRIIDADGTLLPEPVNGTPQVIELVQGGMLDVAISPDYATDGWIYLAFADPLPRDEKRAMLKIVRGRIRDHAWTDEEVIFQAEPDFYTSAGVHFGTRMVFDGGYLYFIVGERGGNMQAQDTSRPNGKIYRVYPDGRIPEDNPFAADKKAIPGIWSYGHRNPQGLTIDPRDHAIYSTEHGPRGGDEFNLIRKGANYGWPVICHGMNYDGSPLNAGLTAKEGMEQPLLHWTPSIAACGLTCYTGYKFPNWKYDFFAGGLRGELHRIRVQNGKVVADEILLSGLGRIRDVRTGPDGFLYIVLNQPDRIVRLVPAE
jgi:glucose/arabinose dehydrogenase